MNHLQWPLDSGGYLRIEWPAKTVWTLSEYGFVKGIFALLLRGFKRNIDPKPDRITMVVGDINLSCKRINRR